MTHSLSPLSCIIYGFSILRIWNVFTVWVCFCSHGRRVCGPSDGRVCCMRQMVSTLHLSLQPLNSNVVDNPLATSDNIFRPTKYILEAEARSVWEGHHLLHSGGTYWAKFESTCCPRWDDSDRYASRRSTLVSAATPFSFWVFIFPGQPASRAASQTNVYLDTFGFRDNQAFDTMSVDSTDSIETSISACSPDNVSRWGICLPSNSPRFEILNH